MDDDRIRDGTKIAIGKWCKRDPATIFLFHELDALRKSSKKPAIRQRLNDEFSGEKGFPIPPDDWAAKQASLKTVGDVRDYVKERNA
jgi:hypothetical protein